jgi:hypothetical protein
MRTSSTAESYSMMQRCNDGPVRVPLGFHLVAHVSRGKRRTRQAQIHSHCTAFNKWNPLPQDDEERTVEATKKELARERASPWFAGRTSHIEPWWARQVLQNCDGMFVILMDIVPEGGGRDHSAMTSWRSFELTSDVCQQKKKSKTPTSTLN